MRAEGFPVHREVILELLVPLVPPAAGVRIHVLDTTEALQPGRKILTQFLHLEIVVAEYLERVVGRAAPTAIEGRPVAVDPDVGTGELVTVGYHLFLDRDRYLRRLKLLGERDADERELRLHPGLVALHLRNRRDLLLERAGQRVGPLESRAAREPDVDRDVGVLAPECRPTDSAGHVLVEQ